MIERPQWLQRIENAWQKRSVVWLSGLRRVGKTTLARMLPGATYLNCDLPSVASRLSDPEAFYAGLGARASIVFDEVHRLEDPSRILKIGADAFPGIRILATGSSTLAATGTFRDSLTGRKVNVYLPPVLWTECVEPFGVEDFDRRLLHGGLPEQLLSSEKDDSFFAEWIDSFYARDVLELFSIRNRTGFMRLLRLLLRQSGGALEYTSLAKHSGLSRPTVMSHLEALSIAHAVFVVPPFHGGSRRELTHQPRCYGADTGLVTFVRGWESIRAEDRGRLWEHLVLDALRTTVTPDKIHYWRDKSGREIDFVLKKGRSRIAVECKCEPDSFDPGNLVEFRTHYKSGDNYVVCPHVTASYTRRHKGVSVRYVGLAELMSRMA